MSRMDSPRTESDDADGRCARMRPKRKAELAVDKPSPRSLRAVKLMVCPPIWADNFPLRCIRPLKVGPTRIFPCRALKGIDRIFEIAILAPPHFAHPQVSDARNDL